jgi:hypothetical protein
MLALLVELVRWHLLHKNCRAMDSKMAHFESTNLATMQIAAAAIAARDCGTDSAAGTTAYGTSIVEHLTFKVASGTSSQASALAGVIKQQVLVQVAAVCAVLQLTCV